MTFEIDSIHTPDVEFYFKFLDPDGGQVAAKKSAIEDVISGREYTFSFVVPNRATRGDYSYSFDFAVVYSSTNQSGTLHLR